MTVKWTTSPTDIHYLVLCFHIKWGDKGLSNKSKKSFLKGHRFSAHLQVSFSYFLHCRWWEMVEGGWFFLSNCINSRISFPWWDAVVASQTGHLLSLPLAPNVRWQKRAGRSWSWLPRRTLTRGEDGPGRQDLCPVPASLAWCLAQGCLLLLSSRGLWKVTWTLARDHSEAVTVFLKAVLLSDWQSYS